MGQRQSQRSKWDDRRPEVHLSHDYCFYRKEQSLDRRAGATSYCWYSEQSSKSHVTEFCVKITQKRSSSPPNWSPNEKTLAKCIWCITYTTTEESSGRLRDMKPESVLVLWLNHASCARHALRQMGSGRMTNRKMNDRKKITIVPTGHNAI